MEQEPAKHFESCQEIFAELSAYLDAELPPDACHELEEHLSGCQPCLEFVNSLRRTVELCRQFKSGALPDPLSASARQELLAAFQKMVAARTEHPPEGS